MLDELVGVIETLKARISEHRAVLQGNEAQTRLSLIDPLLQALGWDTADPAQVKPEYNLSGSYADYALLDAEGKPVAIVEAKKLGETLASHVLQMVNYANLSGVPYAGLTDGDRWELYKVFDQKPLQDRRILSVSVANTPAYQCALQLLLLWHPNMASGQPIEASEPITGTEQSAFEASAPSQAPMQSEPIEPGAAWVSLRDFIATPGTTPPKLRFPGGDVLQPSSWRGLLIEVAEWLIRDGALTQDRCPVSTNQYLDYCRINTEPKHPNGNDFPDHKALSNGLFLNQTSNNAVSESVAIMERLGKDPADVHVQVG